MYEIFWYSVFFFFVHQQQKYHYYLTKALIVCCFQQDIKLHCVHKFKTLVVRCFSKFSLIPKFLNVTCQYIVILLLKFF